MVLWIWRIHPQLSARQSRAPRAAHPDPPTHTAEQVVCPGRFRTGEVGAPMHFHANVTVDASAQSSPGEVSEAAPVCHGRRPVPGALTVIRVSNPCWLSRSGGRSDGLRRTAQMAMEASEASEAGVAREASGAEGGSSGQAKRPEASRVDLGVAGWELAAFRTRVVPPRKRRSWPGSQIVKLAGENGKRMRTGQSLERTPWDEEVCDRVEPADGVGTSRSRSHGDSVTGFGLERCGSCHRCS